MRSNRLFFTLTLLLALMLIVVTGCGGDTGNNQGQAQQDQPLVINLTGGDYGYPSPFSHYQRGPGTYKTNLIFDSLLEKGEEGLIPWLAQSYSVDDQGQVYTFNLQENVTWHDGEPFTADDVVFSYNYFTQHPPVAGDINFSGDTGIDKVEALDDNTVQFTANITNATLLSKIGLMRIIPRHIWEQVDDPMKLTDATAVIGTGPYELTDYNKEQGAYKFVAYPGFWGPPQAVDEIRFIPVSDPVLAFDNQEIDISAVTPDIIGKYQDNDEFKILQNPAFWGLRIMMNMEKRPELQNKDVRQALGYAMDQTELIEKVARGAAVPASAGYLPQDHIWYNQHVKKYPHDPDQARELLKGQKLSFALLTSSDVQEVRIAELLKIQWGAVGVNIEVKSVDTKTRDSAMRNKDYELVLNGHGGWGFEADALRAIYAATEAYSKAPVADVVPGYNNPQVTELANRQVMEMDPQKRRQLIVDLQQLIAEDLPQIPLYNTVEYVVYRPAKYDGWKYMFDHHEITHSKISFLNMN